MTKKQRYEAILSWFLKNQPVAETELHFESPYQLLLAVVLSAQCTDKRVNQVTPALFEAFPDPATLAEASSDDIFPYIRSVSYPNNKARHLSGLGKMLVEEFGGRVPEEPELLQKLPGVGRKTAHVVASVIYDKKVMPVDTHVFRVAARLGLTTRSKSVLDTEKQLVKHIPEDLLPLAHHWLILHGRYICKARKPECKKCPLTAWCAFFNKNSQNAVAAR